MSYVHVYAYVMSKHLVRVAVIVDLVGSRRHPDRSWVHRSLVDALARTNEMVPFDQPLAPTLGDESQGRYTTLSDALSATLILRLVLPEGMDCRAGIGVGAVEELGEGAVGPIQDGPAWWSARDAIVEAKFREMGRNPQARTWYGVSDRLDRRLSDYPAEGLVNSLLLMRDEVIAQMTPRSRRLLLGLLQGRSQSELAAMEGVSQSAVSQSVRRSGALAVVSSAEMLSTLDEQRGISPQ
jgi:DNA-binding CsgD family transcriptional regulator